MQVCPHCKKEVLKTDVFCGHCGGNLEIVAREERLEAEEKEMVKKIREMARKEEMRKKEIQEKEREKALVQTIRKKAGGIAQSIEKAQSKREEILEKLTKIPQEEEKERESFLQMLGVKKGKPKEKIPTLLQMKGKEVIFRPLSRARPSAFEKIWIRVLISILILVMFLAVLVFGFDILKLREGLPLVLPPLEKPEEIIKKPGEITIPPSLLATKDSLTVEISSPEEVPGALTSLLKSGLKEKVFIRIIIKNLEENRVVTLAEFLGAIGVEVPDFFYQKLKPNFTLFTYSPATYQLGFIAEKKDGKELLEGFLFPWEKEMVADFGPFFSLLGKEKLMVAHPFVGTPYLGEIFRYTAFYQENFGLYYALIKDYFIWTTSEETMLKLIEYKAELTEDLMIGSRGKEVEILQTWLRQDIKIYPEGLVTGFFGPLTQKAVMRFQQKYSEEILKPWGLVEGTGVVDVSTREKLNEIYQK